MADETPTCPTCGGRAYLRCDHDGEHPAALIRSVLLFGTGYQWRHPSGTKLVLDPTEVDVFMPANTPPTTAELAAEVEALRSRLSEVERQRDAALENADLHLLAGDAARERIALLESELWPAAEVAALHELAAAAVTFAGHLRLLVATGLGVTKPSQALLAAVDLYSSTVHPPTPEIPNGH